MEDIEKADLREDLLGYLRKAARTSDLLPEQPGDSYCRCTERILEALYTLGEGMK